MVEVSRRSQVILIHEIVKYHLSRIDQDSVSRQTSSLEGSPETITHSSVNSSLEQHGYYLGSRIISRLTVSHSRIWDPNKCMIFLCRDLWIYLFGKQAKRLQSNSQGVYIIFSDDIYWMDNLHFNYSSEEASPSVNPYFSSYKAFYLSLISGVIRGSLKSLGFSSEVTGEYDKPYKFTIRMT